MNWWIFKMKCKNCGFIACKECSEYYDKLDQEIRENEK